MGVTLRQKQSRFTVLVAKLILFAERKGFELTFGDAYRSIAEAERLATLGIGISNSLHTKRLAIDLNLFRNGTYLRATKSYRVLGEWWEQQSDDDVECCWGGRFSRQDGSHFSIAHRGRK